MVDEANVAGTNASRDPTLIGSSPFGDSQEEAGSLGEFAGRGPRDALPEAMAHGHRPITDLEVVADLGANYYPARGGSSLGRHPMSDPETVAYLGATNARPGVVADPGAT